MLPRRHFIAGAGLSAGLSAVAGCASAPKSGAAPGARNLAARGAPLDAAALEDALVGSSYLGCGGGGSLAEARALIAEDLAAGRNFRMISVGALGDEERIACPYVLASLAPMSEDMQARLDAIGEPVATPAEAAFRALERHLDTRFAAVILGEIGPLSLAEGLSIAARLGVPALDADTVGRAVPEINQHSVRVAGESLTPAAGVTLFGDEVILKSVADPSRTEDLFRAMSVVSRSIGVADSPIDGLTAKTKGALVTDSLSLAMRIGRAVREARSAGNDPIDAARRAGEGCTIFRGGVSSFSWRDEDGFLVGDLTLSGSGEFAGETLRLDYKNEHLVATRNNEIVATCPDLITVIDKRTHEGVGNPDFMEGQEVVVLGFKSDQIWRTPAGLAVFSPRYFGYDVDYIPIEERMASAGCW